MFPALHRDYKPLTALRAVTYCPPNQGLKPATLKNHSG